MKLRGNKAGNGFLSGYTLSIATSEARRAGFLDDDGKSRELEKIVDEEKRTITIRVKDGDEADFMAVKRLSYPY